MAYKKSATFVTSKETIKEEISSLHSDIDTINETISSLNVQSSTVYASSSGDDENDGSSPSSPVLTLEKAVQHLRNNTTLSLERGSYFREMIDLGDLENVSVVAHGSGVRPVVSGLDVVDVFSPQGTSNVYSTTISLPEGDAVRAYTGMFEDGIRMTEVLIGDEDVTDTASAIQKVSDTPNSFYFSGPGSQLEGWDVGVKTYYMHTSDNSDPNSNGRTYEVYARAYTITGVNAESCAASGLRLPSGFHHDGIRLRLEKCMIEKMPRHGMLPAVPDCTDVIVAGVNPRYIGGSFHSNPREYADDAIYRNCVAVGDESIDPLGGLAGFYCHGVDAGVPLRDKTTLIDCEAYNLRDAIVFDEVSNVVVSGFKGGNVNRLLRGNSFASAVVRNVDMTGGDERLISGIFGESIPQNTTVSDSKFDVVMNRPFYSSGDIDSLNISDSTIAFNYSYSPSNAPALVYSFEGDIDNVSISDSVVIGKNEAGFSDLVYCRSGEITNTRIRDTLLVGCSDRTGAPVTPKCYSNGSSVEVKDIDPNASVYVISAGKALSSDKGGLRYGTYQPKDYTFSGIAHPGRSNLPRVYVAVGDVVMTTGTNSWLDGTITYIPNEHLNAVTFNLGGDGTSFIAVGDNGTIVKSDSEGEVWTEVGLGISSANLNAVHAQQSAGMVVAAGDSGEVVLSTDGGSTWSQAASVPTGVGGIQDISSNRAGTSWVAVTDSGYILTSTDGSTWATQSSSGEALYAVERIGADQYFLIGGENGRLESSPDGNTWTVRDSMTFNRIVSFGFHADTIVAICRQTSRYLDTILTSTNQGVDWEVSSYVPPFEVNSVVGGLNAMSSTGSVYLEMGFMAVGEAQSAVYSYQGAWGVRRLSAGNISAGDETMQAWLERGV